MGNTVAILVCVGVAGDTVPIAIGRILAVGVGRETEAAASGWGECRRLALTPEVEGEVNGLILAVRGSVPLPLKQMIQKKCLKN